MSHSSPNHNDTESRLKRLVHSDEANQACADCSKKPVLWASWNLGVFLCTNCSGVHRSLGTHISKVKSLTLDNWQEDQIVSLANRGNRWAQLAYCKFQPKDQRIVHDELARTRIIRNKYEQKKWRAVEQPQLNHGEALLKIIDGVTDGHESPVRRRSSGRSRIVDITVAPPKKEHQFEKSEKSKHDKNNRTRSAEQVKEEKSPLEDWSEFGSFQSSVQPSFAVDWSNIPNSTQYTTSTETPPQRKSTVSAEIFTNSDQTSVFDKNNNNTSLFNVTNNDNNNNDNKPINWMF